MFFVVSSLGIYRVYDFFNTPSSPAHPPIFLLRSGRCLDGISNSEVTKHHGRLECAGPGGPEPQHSQGRITRLQASGREACHCLAALYYSIRRQLRSPVISGVLMYLADTSHGVDRVLTRSRTTMEISKRRSPSRSRFSSPLSKSLHCTLHTLRQIPE
jgi:hypothetical protein